MTTLLPIRTDDDALTKYAQLLSACFPGTDKFTRAYLQWLYRDNPDGVAVGFDAWDGDQLAAHYVCIAARADINGVTVPVLLSLNTATHPAHQMRSGRDPDRAAFHGASGDQPAAQCHPLRRAPCGHFTDQIRQRL